MEGIQYTAYLEGSLKLDRFGEWWHNGKPFTNPRLIDLFHRSIVWSAEENAYFVRLGPQRATFECEDTAYFIIRLDDSKLPWQIYLSDGSQEELNPTSLKLGSEGQIYCQVKGTHSARLSKTAHQILAQHVVDSEHILIGGSKVRL